MKTLFTSLALVLIATTAVAQPIAAKNVGAMDSMTVTNNIMALADFSQKQAKQLDNMFVEVARLKFLFDKIGEQPELKSAFEKAQRAWEEQLKVVSQQAAIINEQNSKLQEQDAKIADLERKLESILSSSKDKKE